MQELIYEKTQGLVFAKPWVFLPISNLYINSYSYTSSFVVFIFNSFNSSTITTGANTSNTISNICAVGNIASLNISLNAGINSIININDADTNVAKISLLLLNIPVLKIDFLLSLILYTWTSSDNANT